MEPIKQKTRISAADFFLQLGFIISLYSGIGFLLNILFTVINKAYPAVNGYSYWQPSISLPVAALIVMTPVFLALASIISRRESVDPSRRESPVKKGFTYLTMFTAGGVVVGDLITVLYYFLDGQDLTAAFLYKVLVLLIVLGSVFGYFYSDLKGALSSQARMIWRVGTIALVIATIVLGFTVIGSPRSQRLIRYDSQRITDLQTIQSQIISYWQSKGALPATLDQTKDSLSYYVLPLDPQTKTAYEYKITGVNGFELCTTFNLIAPANQQSTMYSYPTAKNDNWKYEKGHYCFSRTIDPQLYPVYNKNIPTQNQ